MARTARLLVFRLDERSYALNLSQVDRVIRSVDVTPLPQAPDVVLGAIDLQGEIIPVLNVRRRFGVKEREVGISDLFIIARTPRRKVSLAVDGVKDVIARPADTIVPPEKILRRLDQIDGVIQLDDGMTLIHDLDRFMSLDEELALETSLKLEPVHG
jgi:purine-binding chemotaxis protein CheW